ncbi:MAG: FKBP-type peptidyl-prolyl cis-trans isomerase [Arenicellales bacterium]
MNHTIASAALIGTFCLPLLGHADDHKPSTPREQFSYALGFQIGSQIGQQIMAEGLDLDPAFLAQAIRDVIEGNDPKLTIDEMNSAIMSAQQQAQEQSMQQAQAAIDAGNAFREQYANQEGVTRTESGLLYKELTAGTGEKPGPQDTVVVHYRGTLINGTEFDSSIKRNQPATFSLTGIIPGWQEVLQLMPAGARWEVVIPPELAYGSQGAGGAIGPEETLVFEIELIEVK